MKLPLEIRREIYAYIIPEETQRHGFMRFVTAASPSRGENFARDFRSVDRTFESYVVSRQFCTEALEVLFEQFTVLVPGDLPAFSKQMTEQGEWFVLPFYSIRTLAVDCTTSLKFLTLCTNVKDLLLSLWIDNKFNLHAALHKSNNYPRRKEDDARRKAINRRAQNIFDHFDLQNIGKICGIEHLELSFYCTQDFSRRILRHRFDLIAKRIQEMTASVLPSTVVINTKLNLLEIQMSE